MDKWICLKQLEGCRKQQMVNLRNIDKIYCEDDEEYSSYYIVFVYSNIDDEDAQVPYSSKEKRDCAYDEIQFFINLKDAHFMQLESDI